MSTASLNHIGLRTAKLEETRQFFEDVVGLKAGARPPFPFPGYWLYQEGSAVIHLLGVDDSGGLEAYLGPRGQSSAGGSVDHVAFACTGYHEVRQRIERLGLEFQERVVPLVDPPQTAILGVGAAGRRPAVVTQPGAQQDVVVPAWTMTLVLSFDHRFIDGAPAARFLAALSTALTDPGILL